MKNYTTEDERLAARKAYLKQYSKANKAKIAEQKKQWYVANREKMLEYAKQYRETNREKRLEQKKQYYQANREKMLEQKKQYYQANRDKKLEQKKQYYQTNKEKMLEYAKQCREANKAKISEYHKLYNQANREKMLEQKKQWYVANKKKILEQMKQYNKTPMGRARYLVSGYKREDKKRNRGECTLTAQWIIDNIFSSKCHYCEESDWTKLGCDRINNSLPHTEDNVVCCCEDCNKKRGTKSYEEFLAEIKKRDLIIEVS